jgi:hypothetical protein
LYFPGCSFIFKTVASTKEVALHPAKVRLYGNKRYLFSNIALTMHPKPSGYMKKIFALILLAGIMASACNYPKPYYKTREGKKKQKYYNDIQFGGKMPSQMRKY